MDENLINRKKKIFLEKILFCSGIDFEKTPEVLDLFEEVHIPKGEFIIKQGDEACEVFLVYEGKLSVNIEKDQQTTHLADLQSGDIFGEEAVFLKEKRSANVVADIDSIVLKLNEKDFYWIINRYNSSQDYVSSVISKRIKQNIARKVLFSEFKDVEEKAFNEIFGDLVFIELEKGDYVYEKNQPVNGVYFLVYGQLKECIYSEDSADVIECDLQQGRIFGDFDFFDRTIRSSSVFAQKSSFVVMLKTSTFNFFKKKSDVFFNEISTRFIKNTKTIYKKNLNNKPSKIIALLPLSKSFEYRQTSKEMVLEAQKLGMNCTYETSSNSLFKDLDNISEVMIEAQPLYFRFVNWIIEKSTANDTVFLMLDSEATGWNQMCIRFCDEVLLFVNGQESSPSLMPVNDADLDNCERKRLIFLNPNDEVSNTKKWLSQFKVHVHYHIRAGSNKEIQRLARYVANKSTGLILGGGGARATSHIGVLRALQESGIDIDYICGSNMGAVVGFLFAKYRSFEKTKNAFISFLQDMTFDYAFPKVCLYTGAGLIDSLTEHFGDLNIEDLKLPFFSVCTNLSKGTLKIDKEGDVAKALLATNSLPGIYPPVVHDGSLLVDGGIINGLPVEELKNFMLGGKVIAVNTLVSEEMTRCRAADYSVTLWKSIVTDLQDSSEYSIPEITSILMRAQYLAGLNDRAADKIDLLINLPLEDVGFFDFNQAVKLERVGYTTAMKALSD